MSLSPTSGQIIQQKENYAVVEDQKDGNCCCLAWTPRVLALIAVISSLMFLIKLWAQYGVVAGTTAEVTVAFRESCLAGAKISAIVAGGFLGLGILRDTCEGIKAAIVSKNLAIGVNTFFREALYTIAFVPVCCFGLCYFGDKIKCK